MNPKSIFLVVFVIGGVSALLAGRTFRFFRDVQAASPPIGAGSPSAANDKLEKAVKSMFAQDADVRKAELRVHADITKNEVTLLGTVESEAVRSRAVELAKTAHVGVVVNDKMIIKPRGSK
jgi:osmotically-inducible protein OsmY